MRGRRGTRVLALVVAVALTATVVGRGSRDAGADAAGAAEPQFFDTWGSTGGADGELQNPKGVAVDPESGDVYVADTGNDRIVRYDADGRLVDIFGTDPVEGLPLDEPWDVAVSEVAGAVYVADTGNDRVVVFSRFGLPVYAWGSTGSGQLRFRAPRGIHAGGDGTMYVADTGNNKVKTYTVAGVFTGSFGSSGSGPGQLRAPRDVTGDSDHSTRLFIADTGNDRVSVWDLVDKSFVGTFGSSGTGNRRFEAPGGIWEGGDTAATESIFVADTGNDRISVWRYDADTDTATWESRFGATGDDHEQLEAPRNVAVDHDLRRYVIDTTNDRLQLFDPSGPPGVFGRVTNTFGVAVNGIGVIAQDATTFDTVVAAETDRDGNYQLPLPPGDYLLTYFDPDGGHRPEYHPDATDFADAEPVPVQANTVTRADIVLSVNAINPVPVTGTIVGTVEEAGAPAARTWVFAVDANTGTLVRAVQADPAGQFEIGGLATGNYLVVYLDPRGVNATEFHDDHLDPAQADVLAVTSGGPPVQADADLAPPP